MPPNVSPSASFVNCVVRTVLGVLAWIAPAIPAAGLEGSPVHLQSAGSVGVTMVEGHRVVEFEDSVVFDYAGYHLTAGRLTMNEAIGRAWADGGIRLSGPAGTARASRVWLELKTERLVLEDLEAKVGPWSASAEKGEVHGYRIDLHNAILTSCPTPNPLYSLHARQLSRESPIRFVARGVVPYFYKVPFFYLPRYSYELEKEEEGGDTYVPGRQGLDFKPGRGSFPGPFLKSSWTKKFLDRQLLSTFHFDYHFNPGLAVGEEITYRSRTAEHYTFAYFTPQRNIDRAGGYSRLPGRVNRWRVWQVWTKKFSFGTFRSFVNEASDSFVDDDYRLDLDERRLREREINTEFVMDWPNWRLKLVGERLKTLQVGGPKEYRLEKRLAPAIRFLTFPFPIARRDPDGTRRGWRFYGVADAMGGHGKDRTDRLDGLLSAGQFSGMLSVPVTARMSTLWEAGLASEYHSKKISSEQSTVTPIGHAKLTFHRPWLNERLQTDAGYSIRKAFENKALFAGGEPENLLFMSLRHRGLIWRNALDFGYDLRDGHHGLSTINLHTTARSRASQISSILRIDPEHNRAQSISTQGTFNIGDLWKLGLGVQTVRTDTESQVQFGPLAQFESRNKIYRGRLSGTYDAKLSSVRTIDLNLTRAFKCIETTLGISKRDDDFQFNFSFRLTGFRDTGDYFRRPAP